MKKVIYVLTVLLVIGILAGCNSTDVPAAPEKESNTADTSVDVEIGKTTAAEISTEKAFPGESENISDPKTAIYNRMLNTIDYFNALSATMETSMLNNEIATVEYNTNINSGESYQKVSVGEKTMTETYGRNDSMINVNNTSGQYLVMQGQMFGRDDAPYIPLEKRKTMGCLAITTEKI